MIKPIRNNLRLSFLTFFALFFAVSFIVPQRYSYAHKVQMFAHVEGSEVLVEGYFADGKKAKYSEVTVFDNRSGEKLLNGKTDDSGKFSFNIPMKTDLRISLNASLGHKTEQVLPESELSGAGRPESAGSMGVASVVKVKNGIPDQKSQDAIFSKTGEEEIQLMIEKGIEKGVTPLLRGFSECKERVYYSEIIGGIGYIFGIMGIVLYFKTRKNK